MRVDCHVHIVGPAERYPQVAERTYLAGLAPVETLIANGAPHGISRFVIVQPSFYGDDNSCTLDALDALAGRGRGVAVVDPESVRPESLADFHRRGVRGLRINLYSPVASPAGDNLDAAFAATAAIAQAMNWHVQVIAPLPLLLANARLLSDAPVSVVIDHYGLYGGRRPDSDDGRRLLALVSLPHVWMKLSAPYRHDRGSLNVVPDRAWIEALLGAAPDRCVWGSDWPHPPPHDTHRGPDVETTYRALSYARLVDEFLAVLPAALWADRIMIGNPVRLYGF
ncbi:MAG: amidohydrolase [Alphaproteobacteria bacterium]|nr:amidohydrolase [Alphaproteobacteria bacterium]